MAFLINPSGDFPIDDVWAYGLPVKVFHQEGTIHFTLWQSMTLITRVFRGALFCLPTGFSFTALRISSMTLGKTGAFNSRKM